MRISHQTIKRVSDDFETFDFNTIISTLMEMTNALQEHSDILGGTPVWNEALTTLLLLMAPVTPHLTEELWARQGKSYSIHNQPWPAYDPELAKEEQITLIVQVNGKVRDRIIVDAGISEEDARTAALASEAAQRFTEGKQPKEVIVVPGRLVNIVV
jgi:leucyl-tRNA synthetase